MKLMYTICNKIMFWNEKFKFLRCDTMSSR
jgi:hypothetical protein